MREVFQQELADVQARLVEIASLVETSIQQAVAAFTKSDVALAEQVIDNDRRIDELAVALDEAAIEIIALQQPVARDLRVVVSVLRISASLERQGDLAAHLAQIARYRFPQAPGPESLRGVFEELGRLDVELAAKQVALLKSPSSEIVNDIKASDDRVDELHGSTFGILSTEPDGIEVVDATLAARYFERFADHAVEIANKIQYQIDGSWEQSKEPGATTEA